MFRIGVLLGLVPLGRAFVVAGPATTGASPLGAMGPARGDARVAIRGGVSKAAEDHLPCVQFFFDVLVEQILATSARFSAVVDILISAEVNRLLLTLEHTQSLVHVSPISATLEACRVRLGLH